MSEPLSDENRPQMYSVELVTARWDEMVRFYRDVLGLRSLIRIVEDGFAQLLAGRTCVVLLSRESVPPPSARYTLVLEVPDVDAAARRLRAAGCIIEGPQRNEEGIMQVKLSDPEGNRVMVFSW